MAILDAPPSGKTLTSYDRQNMKLYLRLLDARQDGATWQEAVDALFELPSNIDPERAKLIHDSHLARAEWLTRSGYKELAAQS